MDYRRHHDLPPFNGRPEDWPMFNSAFRTTTQAYGYSELENLLRLQKSLSGPARTTVESMLIHPHHVGHAMATLEAAFGRPELLLRSQLKLARELPLVTDANMSLLVQHALVVQNLATYLDSESTQHYLANPTLIEELVNKLPMSRRLEWAAVSIEARPHPTLTHYATWISGIARLISLVTPDPDTYTVRGNVPKSRGRVLLNVDDINANQSSRMMCVFCGRAHDVQTCGELFKLSIPDRIREISKRPLCLGCLSSKHILPACKDKLQCGIDGCTQWHIRQLHLPNNPSQSASIQDQSTTPQSKRRTRRSNKKKNAGNLQIVPSNNNETVQVVQENISKIYHCNKRYSEGSLFFRIIPVILKGPTRIIKTFALLDEGSSLSLIDADLANDLQLCGPSSNLNVQWFGSQSTNMISQSVNLGISGEQPNAESYNISNVRTIKRLTLPNQSVDRFEVIKTNPHLRDVPFASYKNAVPKILLGLDNHHIGVPRQVQTSQEEDGIAAMETKIGWVIYGSDGSSMHPPRAEVMHIYSDNESESFAQLHELVQQHFTTEDFGIKTQASIIESDENIRARQILHQTTRRTGLHFETGLLWKNSDVKLPDSYDMALKRLASVESKMRRQPEYATQYKSQISSYIEKGVCSKVDKGGSCMPRGSNVVPAAFCCQQRQ